MREERAGQEPSKDRRRWISRLRDRVRATPAGRHFYRVVVAVIGAVITILGLALVPLPGPGWFIVIVGLIILASEFVWAQRLLDEVRSRLHAWTRWLLRHSIGVRLAISLVTAGFVAGAIYLVLRWRGVPDWVLELVPLPSLV